MKFKFSAEPKDWLIFAIFSFLLLNVVAIALLNLHQFALEGTLHGLDPLPAFAPDMIWITILFWIGAEFAIIFSVSNRFWDKEEGFGISFKKKDPKGYSRWTTDKEMKKAPGIHKVDPASPDIKYAGVPVANDGRYLWVDDSELHTLVIGSTGSGKSQLIVMPTISLLARKGESMIITDPKGEIYRDDGALLKEKGYNIVILNFREPQNGNSWNPLAVPYDLYQQGKKDKAIELLEDLGINIVHEDKAQDDPFWQNAGGDFFNGLAIALFEDAKLEEINLNSIYRMSVAADEKYGSRNLLNVYFSFKDPTDPAFVNAASTINAPVETKGSVLSVFRTKIKTFASRENISEMLSKSDFDMSDIGRKKTAVFICLQDEKTTYHALGTIFIKQCYETLIAEAAKSKNGKLPYRTNFILDEFANMPAFKDIGTMVSAARSRNIRMMFIIQDFGALDRVYGKETASTIKGNCGNIIYLISTELSALEEISKLCGEKESKKEAKTASTPLVTVSDLQRLPRDSVIILHDRNYPYKAKFTKYYLMNEKGFFGKHYPAFPTPEEHHNKVEVFDIIGYTKKKQEEIVKKKEEEDRAAIAAAMAELEAKEKEAQMEIDAQEKAEKEAKEKKEQEEKARKEQEEKERQEAERQKEIADKAKKIQEEEKKRKEEARKKQAQNMPKTKIINDDAPEIKSGNLFESKEEKKPIETEKKQDTKTTMDEVSDDEFFDDFFNDEE